MEIAYLFAALFLAILALGFAWAWLDEMRERERAQRSLDALRARSDQCRKAVQQR